jgi:hypothetical protein
VAVRAWRTGSDGEAGTSDGQRADEGSPQSTIRRRPQSARASTPAVCMEVQTERPAARPATARPRTARPRTYFEKVRPPAYTCGLLLPGLLAGGGCTLVILPQGSWFVFRAFIKRSFWTPSPHAVDPRSHILHSKNDEASLNRPSV